MVKGLSSIEAIKQLESHGYNELPSSKPKNIWRIALEVMKEPMFLLLISCGLLYMILGDYREGGILLSTIFIIIFITFYQYQKTEKALDALKRLSSPRALVIRNGKEIRIAGREVVPGDIIILNEGDRVPADAKLVEVLHLTVDESLLTGESVPVTKSFQANLTEPNGLVYSGTLVVQGKGMARVVATGIHTQFGKIGASLQNIEQDETRLQKEMKVLIRNFFIVGVFICIGVVLAFYFTRGHFIQSLLNGLAAAMAILPEEFPVVLTVFLALGAWRLSKNNVLTRKQSAIETLGSATVLCIHASQKNSIDPMEKAIGSIYQTIVAESRSVQKLIKEYPLSKTLFAMTRVLQTDSGDEFLVYCKGAPEAIFALCKMDEQEKATHLWEVQKMAEKGYRVIAVASGTYCNKMLPESQHDFDFKFKGLIGLEDPIRPEVPQAIKECNDAGIKVIMITGDFPATAKSIATQIGMDTQSEILTGDEMKYMSNEELRQRIDRINIFARVIPEQKLRMVQALKANQEIVAMTGDGVNDAPALKAAHIGIAMGSKGTDVAREASSLVLLDDNFASIVSAIRSGRKIFDNLQKAMSYILAIHIPIIGLTLLPAFFTSLPLLLMPLHIVFMELIIDPVCSIAFESEQEERGIMNRPPRDPNRQFFSGKRMLYSAAEGFLVLAVVIGVYFFSIHEGHTEGEVRAIAFSSLIVSNIFLILTNLSKTRSFVAVITEKNTAVWVIILAAILMLLLIISVPSLQEVFSFLFPGYQHFFSSLTGAAAILLILESIKYFRFVRTHAVKLNQ
ncbi:MAG: cation-translocating P-type ATPase [Bacteroidetes bacterium]|nr:cation-translocating P-type ATPase [Bacteroidota bacterium]